MVEHAYEQLKTPKSVSEIHNRFNEIGIQWNLSQVKLFLEMDKKITKKEGLYSIVGADTEEKVLETLERLFKDRPKIPIKRILEEIPVTIGKSELLEMIEGSKKYYSPNDVIIIKK